MVEINPDYMVGLPPPTVGAGQTAAATFNSTTTVKADRVEKTDAKTDDSLGSFNDFFSYNFSQNTQKDTASGINTQWLPPPNTNYSPSIPAAPSVKTSAGMASFFEPNLAVMTQITLNQVAQQLMKTQYSEAMFAILFITVTIDLAKSMAQLSRDAAYTNSKKEMNNAMMSFAQAGISGASLMMSAYSYGKSRKEVNESLDNQKTKIDKWEKPDSYDEGMKADPDLEIGKVRSQRRKDIKDLEVKQSQQTVHEDESLMLDQKSDKKRLDHLKNLDATDDQSLLEAKRSYQMAESEKDVKINQVFSAKMQKWEGLKNMALQALQGGRDLNVATLGLAADLDNAQVRQLEGYYTLAKQQQERFFSDEKEKESSIGSIIEAVKKVQDEHARALTFSIH